MTTLKNKNILTDRSGGTSGSLESNSETQATPSEVTNGNSDVQSGHRSGSKWLTAAEKEDRSLAGGPSNSAAGTFRDGTKKSLSFYADLVDSSSSSDEEAANGSEQNNDPKELSQATRSGPSIHQKSAVPLESDQEESSSTSSCSCEDHSSGAREHPEDEDPHGDLDYDDDSITNSPSNGNKTIGETADISKDDATSNSESSNHKTPATERQQKSPQADAGDSEKSGEASTKIRSFINTDRGVKNGDKEASDPAKKQFKDRSHKSYEHLLKYFFKDTCYFQIKSINHENIQISKSMGVWSTPTQNEVRLNMAFREHRNVILIFSVQRSGAFQGFARMASDSRPTAERVPWVLPARLSNANLGGVFQVQWLCTKELDFSQTRDLFNPFNDNKPVKVARDGQEVEPKVGRKLCSLFPRDSKKRLLGAVEQLKDQTKHRKQTLQHNGFYPMDDMRGHGSIPYNRRRINGMHFPTMPNGYESVMGPSSSLPQQYSYPPESYDIRDRLGGTRRRPHIHPHQRRGAPPSQGQNFYQGPAYYDHPMIDYATPGPASSAPYPAMAHNKYYTEPYGSEYSPYPGPAPGPGPHHPRNYQEYSMNPIRYHPYQRARR